ncbi:hypothetical protein CL618_02860 [archaeon]|nr:hypothetical protein [archaeon]|tara:strand:+ start:1510 stop:1740 length:231 start_codon:yes stop_codon:yes gene_type:complete
MVDPLLGSKIVYVLGFVNIFGLLLVLFSCRCLGFRLKIGASKFYKYHCYYWWIFIISVLLHALLAFNVFGNPFKGG